MGGLFLSSYILTCWLRKQPAHLVGPPFSSIEDFSQSAWMGGFWPRVPTIEILLMSGCGWSHESSHDSCKSTYVKFGDHANTQQNMVHLNEIELFAADWQGNL